MRIPRAHRLEAVGLWTIAGAWSVDHQQDGKVPAYMVEEWGPSDAAIAGLVATGLWIETEDGYEFHDWSEYQFTKVEVAAHRESERRRKEDWRKRKAEREAATRGTTGQSPGLVPPGQNAGQPDVSHGTTGRVPSLHSTSLHITSQQDKELEHPAPIGAGESTPKKASGRQRGTRIPDPFVLTAKMREALATECFLVNLDAETKVFVDYWRGIPGVKGEKLDWIATWRNSMRRKQEMLLERGGGSAPGPGAPPDAFAAASKQKRAGWLAAHGVTDAQYQAWVDADGFEAADARVNARKVAQA
jgi:hypothetical protein